MKLVMLSLLVATRVATAGTVQVPEGGKPVIAIAKGVVCGPVAGGWTIDPVDRRLVMPPAATVANPIRALDVKVADTAAACATTKQTITLVELGPWPEIDATGTVFYPDDGRIELRGQKLKGLQIAWRTAGDKPKQGADVCLDPAAGKQQTCAVPVPHGLPADPLLSWLPANGRFGDDVTTYDALGNWVDPDTLRLRPARTVLTKPLVQTSGVDVTSGPARVLLSHPEAVASVDCGTAICELTDAGVSVRSVSDPVNAVAMRLRLVPRMYSAKGDSLETVVTASVPLLSCAMTVVAGTAVRDVDDPLAAVRLDPGCSRDPNNLRWAAGGDQAEIRAVVKATDGIYVLLHLARLTGEHVTVTAARPELGNTIVASATGKTEPLPEPHVALELDGHGKIDFVPNNRPARITVSSAGATGAFTPLPIDGAYEVVADKGGTAIRAAEGAEGFVSLRLAYRVKSLPGELASANLAVVTERVQRAVREAAVPAPIGASAYAADDHSLVELVCGDDDGAPHRVAPGKLYRIPWASRDSCRVVLHRERLAPADGAQEITVDIDVTKPDNTPRPEQKVSEHVILRPGGEPRVIPVKGGLDQFDKVEIRVAHVVDESRYVQANAAPKPGVLSAQWSAIVDGGRLRLYATATIPAGLYRVNNPSGQLTLNFGVLSRLTTLDRQGKEGLFGLELGVMGLALAPQQSNVEFPTTLAVVAGVGFRVPLGQGAAIGIQAWVAREFRSGPIEIKNPDGSTMTASAGPWSFIFGPSISFGNVGLNL